MSEMGQAQAVVAEGRGGTGKISFAQAAPDVLVDVMSRRGRGVDAGEKLFLQKMIVYGDVFVENCWFSVHKTSLNAPSLNGALHIFGCSSIIRSQRTHSPFLVRRP